jgi:hypothetical protein
MHDAKMMQKEKITSNSNIGDFSGSLQAVTTEIHQVYGRARTTGGGSL